MNRKTRSRSRSLSGIRKHVRKHSYLMSDKSSDSELIEDDKECSKINRMQYTLSEKKNIVEKYYELKEKHPKKGNRFFAKMLNVPYSCLLE